MSIYTTPLQFGYFLSLLFFLLFLVRGIRQERLSDILIGVVMLILALELQDYTFGFSGINVLWEELNGFPRGVKLLFGPAVYFYMRAQVMRSFRFRRGHWWHLLPWASFFIFDLVIFLRGPYCVQQYQQSGWSEYINYFATVAGWVSYFYYLSRSLVLYNRYRKWALDHFSNTDLFSFSWFRNFIYGMIAIVIVKESLMVLSWLLEWDFYQDWWWNLVIVAVAAYVGISGFVQYQPPKIEFSPSGENAASPTNGEQDEKRALKAKLEAVMTNEKLFLEPELSLSGLAKQLKTRPSLLSSTINQLYHMNFNDYINQLRVEAFIAEYLQPENRKYTMLSVAYGCGFNSKATFNRAFRKLKGASPKEYFARKQAK